MIARSGTRTWASCLIAQVPSIIRKYVGNRKIHRGNSISCSKKRHLLHENTEQRAIQLCLEDDLDMGLPGCFFSGDSLL